MPSLLPYRSGEGQGTRLVSDQMWAIKGQSFPVTRQPLLTLVPVPCTSWPGNAVARRYRFRNALRVSIFNRSLLAAPLYVRCAARILSIVIIGTRCVYSRSRTVHLWPDTFVIVNTVSASSNASALNGIS